MHGESLQSCLTLSNPVDCSPPCSSVHRSFQARTLEWVAMPFSRGSSCQGSNLHLLHLLHWQAGFFTTRSTWEAHLAYNESKNA